MAKSVSINPSQHVDDGGLLDLSLEEVVARFLGEEKQRYRKSRDDESEQEVAISAKVTPMGLVAVLNLASYNLHISRSMLTKCLSRQVSSWYDSIPDLVQLSSRFYEVYAVAVSGGRPDLCNGLRNKAYYYVNALTGNPTNFRSIAWVRNKLNEIAQPLGLSATLLFHIGLCRSLLTASNKLYCGTTDEFLRYEVDRFMDYLGARSIYMNGFMDQVIHYLKPRNHNTLIP